MSEFGSYLFHHFLGVRGSVDNISLLIFYCDLPLDGTLHRGRAGKLTQERLRVWAKADPESKRNNELRFP